MPNIRTDLIIRVCIITAIFSVISYILLRRNEGVQDMPALFVLFGIVILISILYDIERFHAISKPDGESKTSS
jgi:type III secretory pathway component EscR